MASECIFCGAVGANVLSKEHVVPQWLLKHLGIFGDDQMFHAVVDNRTGEITKQRTHSSLTFVEGRVCEKKCNNGWMRRLEDEAKPVLVPLVDGQRPPTDLSPSERAIVAKWTTKTAYVHSWAGLLGQPIQVSHLHSLYGDEGTIPQGVGVFSMQAPFEKPSSYLQRDQWPVLGHRNQQAKPPKDSYKIGLQFGQLYLLTAFWPGTYTYQMITARHIPLWPISPDPWSAYDGWISADSGLNTLSRFVSELAVIPT